MMQSEGAVKMVCLGAILKTRFGGALGQEDRGYTKRIHSTGGKAQQPKHNINSLFASRFRPRINPVAKTQKYKDGMGLGIS